MKIPFGKYRGIHIYFINSGYLKYIIRQEWFFMKYDDLAAEVEKELAERDRGQSHFYEDIVSPDKEIAR